MPCFSPLKGFRDPETGGWIGKGRGSDGEMAVACGQCLGCRLDRSRMWAMRCVHEASLHERSCFITLSYRSLIECDSSQLENQYHVPADWSLHKSHLQKFWKRVRKHFRGQLVRYFACGEYGNRCKHGLDLERVGCPLCNVGRPHYHALVFGIDFEDRVEYGENLGEPRYTSPTLEQLWKYGFVDVGELNFSSAAYVSRYILKKVNGVRAESHYLQTDLDGCASYVLPEFSVMSRGRPCRDHRKVDISCASCQGGIGAKWFARFNSDVFPSDEVPVPGQGVLKGVPRYYEKLFEISDPLTLEEIREKRKEWIAEHSDQFTSESLMSKYKVKQRAIETLERKL